MNNSQLKRPDLQRYFEEIDANRNDIQGLISHGYRKLPAARYLLFRITNPLLAKQHLGSLVDQVKNAGETRHNENKEERKPAVQMAFTSSGLKALGLPNDAIDTFPREFLEGMSYSYDDLKNPGRKITERSTLLGDVGLNDPANWHWGNEDNTVDCLLLFYAKNTKELDPLTTDIYPDESTGLELAHTADTFTYDPDKKTKEHFGFMDGISQPIIKGFNKSGEIMDDKELFNPGEFILGFANQYQTYTHTPYIQNVQGSHSLHALDPVTGKKDLGKNGTYLVFRQMEQHVEKFWRYLFHNSKEKAATQNERAIKLAAKMVGRWPEGEPLVTSPEKPDHTTEADKDLKKDLNSFNYSKIDNLGLRCPFGAHIRRTNPRDQVHAGRGDKMSLEMSNKHRMLRRGRIYGNPLDPDFNIDNIIDMVRLIPLEEMDAQICYDINSNGESTEAHDRKKIEIKRGINFICLVSDISRQFEFVQSVWTNTRTFGELTNEADPIISPGYTSDTETHADFTTPQQNVRNRYKAVPEFTNVVGGAYFFMPGIRTLKYLLNV
jgi:Dyp-type peroxidase family